MTDLGTGTTPDPSIELNMRMPWLTAESESIWEITGTCPSTGTLRSGTFTECLAQVVPHYVTGGPVLFQMLGGLMGDQPVSPSRITRARELLQAERPAPVPSASQAEMWVVHPHSSGNWPTLMQDARNSFSSSARRGSMRSCVVHVGA